MAVTNFIPTLWAGALLSSLKKSSVFTQPAVCNRNYEGEITGRGSTVKITSVGAIAVADYTSHTDITIEEVDDATQSLVVNQAKYFAFELDDVEAAQALSAGGLMQEAMQEAAYALAQAADLYVAGLFSGAAGGNQISTTAVTTPALAVTGLINLKTKLDQANVPQPGRYVVVPPWYHALLLGSDLFVRADASGSADTLRNGMVGRAFGFDVLLSNNVTNTTGDDYRICAGYPGAITFAEQVNKVEAFRLEARFADGVKGLHLYGAKVTRSVGIATLIASQT